MLLRKCLKKLFKLFRKLRNGEELFFLDLSLPICRSNDRFNNTFISSRNKPQGDHHRIIDSGFVHKKHMTRLTSVYNLTIFNVTLVSGYLEIAGDNRYTVVHEHKAVFMIRPDRLADFGIIDHIDELRFRSQTEKHELSHLYEAKIKNMGNAGRNGGEYYTPRPLIRAIVQVVKPKIGDRIYDGAVGSAGFLCESFEYMKSKGHLTTKDLTTLQTQTFYGKEKKSLAYVIAIMNMILHGIEAPNIVHTNTLTETLADIQEKDRYDVALANPPFGGNERKEVQQNFPIRTGETAFLFLQHFIKILKAGGRGGVVIKNTFLSNADNASVSLRKQLLESCNLHTVLDCPGGTFQGAGVKTVVLFFEKGAPTRKVWFYKLDPGRNLGKTNPLNDDDLAEFVKLQKTFADSPKSWSLDAKTIDLGTFDLSVKNPNGGEEIAHRSPEAIMEEIAALDAESAVVLRNIRALL
jgi:type I restriction enzyme M protein